MRDIETIDPNCACWLRFPASSARKRAAPSNTRYIDQLLEERAVVGGKG
jgi:hypothetical protein